MKATRREKLVLADTLTDLIIDGVEAKAKLMEREENCRTLSNVLGVILGEAASPGVQLEPLTENCPGPYRIELHDDTSITAPRAFFEDVKRLMHLDEEYSS